MSGYAQSLAGGLLIGLSAAMMLLLNGRIAGISGIVASLFRPLARPLAGERRWADSAFVAGLLAAPPLFALATGAWPVMRIEASLPLLVVAGVLVGFGTRLGSGCTSGHGVAGLARLSPRSLAAVLTFLASGIATVALMRIVG